MTIGIILWLIYHCISVYIYISTHKWNLHPQDWEVPINQGQQAPGAKDPSASWDVYPSHKWPSLTFLQVGTAGKSHKCLVVLTCFTHLEKWWSSSMGRMTSHILWKNMKFMLETTNQSWIFMVKKKPWDWPRWTPLHLWRKGEQKAHPQNGCQKCPKWDGTLW